MAVYLAKRALRGAIDELPVDVADDLATLPAAFGQQSLGAPVANLNLKKLNHRDGAWRVRTGDWRSIFFQTGEDFLVAAIGPRRDVYERLPKLRLARWGGGVRIIETAAVAVKEGTVRDEARVVREARRPKPVENNGFSPFEDSMLHGIEGMDDDLLAYMRALPPTVDAPGVIAQRVGDIDLAFLLADLWERPQHHLNTFARGAVPSVDGLAIEAQELKARLTDPVSETELIAIQTGAQIRKVLDRSIEDWMVYLHPSQRAIAKATFNGPARVRGGPGTGKTVVALHRARVLARRRVAQGDKVLLTTFLSTLPPVWTSLMGLLDAKALERLEVRNIDVLARSLVADARAGELVILDGPARQKIAESLLKRHGLGKAMADSTQLLLDEFDAFLAGRDLDDLEAYLALRRRGGGSGLGRADRERVFAAFEAYRGTLRKRGALDWPHLRIEALRLAEAGGGPRFDGVIIDEAQDLSAVGMRLLLALDKSEDHRHFLIVGDGQQSIYPGGYGLREIGVDIVGRSRVLTANWRNTWSVWTAARAVMEGVEFDDLDEDVGLRPTGDEPAPLTMGDLAELHVLRSPAEELVLLGELVKERISAGIDAGDIAVLVEVKRKGDAVVRELERVGVSTVRLDKYDGQHADGVLVGTFNRAKGLEFKEVVVPGLAADEWTSRWFVPPHLEGEQRAERMALQVRTLFVGLSRARDRLVLLSGGVPCEPVRRAQWALDVREY